MKIEVIADAPICTDNYKQYAKSQGARTGPIAMGPAEQLMLAEHQKVIDEIKMRIQQEDDWYRYEVGGFLIYLAGGTTAGGRGSLDERLGQLLASP